MEGSPFLATFKTRFATTFRGIVTLERSCVFLNGVVLTLIRLVDSAVPVVPLQQVGEVDTNNKRDSEIRQNQRIEKGNPYEQENRKDPATGA